MMVALHRYIEITASGEHFEREEFILRGFVERHIEICDYPQCNCLEYYKVINTAYRLQLATVASMKEQGDHSQSMAQQHQYASRKQLTPKEKLTTSQGEGDDSSNFNITGGFGDDTTS